MTSNGYDHLICLFTAYASSTELESSPPITGGERHFVEVVKVWQRLNERPEIITTRSGERVCRSQGLVSNFRLLPIEGLNFGIIGAYLFRSLQGVTCILRYHGNVCTYSATDILPDVLPAVVLKIARGNRSRMISWVFHLIPHFTKRPGSKLVNFISYESQRLSFLLMRRYSDEIIVDNSSVKNDLIALGFNNKKIVVVPLGVDKQAIDAAKPETGQTYEACFLGRLHRTKGVFDLIEVWRLVVKQNENARLAIIGGDPTGRILSELEKKVLDYGLGQNIFFLGWLPIEDFSPIMKSSKMFLFPSHEEGWAIAVCEAMTAGLVPVVYDLAAYREFFKDGVMFVRKGDTAEFARIAIELLSNEKELENMRSKAKQVALKYSWDSTAKTELQVVHAVK